MITTRKQLSEKAREGMKINRRIYRHLKRKYPGVSNNKLWEIVTIIPNYNPTSERKAKVIGENLVLKYKNSGKIGGVLS